MSERLAQDAEVLGLSGNGRSPSRARPPATGDRALVTLFPNPSPKRRCRGSNMSVGSQHAMPIRLIRDLSQQKPD
jgi:hypothetical protein